MITSLGSVCNSFRGDFGPERSMFVFEYYCDLEHRYRDTRLYIML